MENIKTMTRKELAKLLREKLVDRLDIVNGEEFFTYFPAMLITPMGKYYDLLPEKRILVENGKEEIVEKRDSIEEQLTKIPDGEYEVEIIKEFNNENLGLIKLIG